MEGDEARGAAMSEERRRLLELLVARGGPAGGNGEPGDGEPGDGARRPRGHQESAGRSGSEAGAREASAGKPPPFSPLVRMKPGGSRRPFFCVHAIFGSAFPYHQLALRLDREQPFYGLQARGLDGRDEPLDRIEEMAASYVEAVSAVQPRGPYRVGGYSFGGLVAYEMAQQWVRAGERVELVALFGTGAPPFLPPDAAELLELGRRYAEDQARLLHNASIPERDRLEFDFDRLRRGGAFGVPPMPRLAAAHAVAQATYAPRPYAGRAVLFITREQQLLCRAEPTLGWWMLCAGGVEVVPVGGNHLDLFEEPQVSELAAKLDSHLGKESSRGTS